MREMNNLHTFIYCFFNSKKNLNRRKFLLTGASIVTANVLLLSSNIASSNKAYNDGPRKINLAGRQRMLIQRMGKLICLAYLNEPQKEDLLQKAETSLQLYENTAHGLLYGDEKLGFSLPENNKMIVKAFGGVEKLFTPYAEVIRHVIATQEIKLEDIVAIGELNNDALNAMDDTVHMIERVYKNTSRSETLAMLINIAGQMRMLTQKVFLELCLYRILGAEGVMKNDIYITMSRFNVSLDILEKITSALFSADKKKTLLSSLNEIRSDWQILQIDISNAAKISTNKSNDSLLTINNALDDMLEKINTMVFKYETLAS